MKTKSRTNLTLKNGITIEIVDMPIEKYEELTTLIESRSDERIDLNGIGYFAPKDIAKISRNE